MEALGDVLRKRNRGRLSCNGDSDKLFLYKGKVALSAASAKG